MEFIILLPMAGVTCDPAMARFLASLQLRDLEPLMAQHRISLEAARFMTDMDWSTIGVPIGARRLIMGKIATYQDVPPPPQPSPDRTRTIVIEMHNLSDDTPSSGHCRHCKGLSGVCSCKARCARTAKSGCYPQRNEFGEKRPYVHILMDCSGMMDTIRWSHARALVLRIIKVLTEQRPDTVLQVMTTNRGTKINVLCKLPVNMIDIGKLRKDMEAQVLAHAPDIFEMADTLRRADPDEAIKKTEAEYANNSWIFVGGPQLVVLPPLPRPLAHMAWVDTSNTKQWTAAYAAPIELLLHPSILANRKNGTVIRLRGHTDEPLPPASLCSICYDRAADVVLQPCGHCVACSECTPALFNNPCPLCRTTVVRSVPLDEAISDGLRIYTNH